MMKITVAGAEDVWPERARGPDLRAATDKAAPLAVPGRHAQVGSCRVRNRWHSLPERDSTTAFDLKEHLRFRPECAR